jgi:hypothetical protein
MYEGKLKHSVEGKKNPKDYILYLKGINQKINHKDNV